MVFKHLTLTSRCVIEKYLNLGYSFREIAAEIGCQPSTISREVKNNRTIIKPKNPICRNYAECRKHSLCDSAGCSEQCRRCDLIRCVEICDEYIPRTCSDIEKAPFVCNNCQQQEHCTREHAYYLASKADAKRAFNKTDYWFEDIEEEGDDYRKGWLAGVCDANVEKYEYLTGNMIILVQTQVVSCWAEPIEPADEGITEDKPEVKAVEEVVDKWSQSYRDGIIELMRETFK